MPKLYQDPTLFDAGGDTTKTWYVVYWFENPETLQFERFRPTFNGNRIHDPVLKRRYFKAAVDFMKEVLERGYNPYLENELTASQMAGFLQQKSPVINTPTIIEIALPDTQEPITPEPLSEILTDSGKKPAVLSGLLLSVSKALDELLKGATKPARDTYRGMYNRFEKFIQAKSYNGLDVTEVTADIVYEFQDYLKEEMGLAKKTVNGTLSHVGMFWDTKTLKKEANHVNPFRNLTPLKSKDYRGKEKKKGARDHDFVPLTADEMDTVIGHYNKVKAKNFLRFLGTIYYAWTRPVEATRLKVGDIDLQHRSIRFLKENTKDYEFAHVQIVDDLYQLLITMNLKAYPSSYYLFSDDFMPGEKQLSAWRDITDKWWTPHVVKTLGIDKKMYAIKHTGNIEYIQRNKGKVDILWQQMQNRHGSPDVTQRYNKRLGVYFVDTDMLKFRSFM